RRILASLKMAKGVGLRLSAKTASLLPRNEACKKQGSYRTLKPGFARDDTHAMSENKIQEIRERLIQSVNKDGGWGYGPKKPSASEATALAAIALHDQALPEVTHALDWLARLQRSDGAVPVYAGMCVPCWPTSLAVLAWVHLRSSYESNI